MSLLDRLGTYLYHRMVNRLIRQGRTVGDYVVVPRGYIGKLYHKQPASVGYDPVDLVETIGWKLRPCSSAAHLATTNTPSTVATQ